jgi:hypothetical protein
MNNGFVLIILLLTSLLSACSSNKVAHYQPNPCITDWGATEQDGKTSSYSRTQCTDKPQIEHVVKDAGVANECRISRPVGVKSHNPKYGETLICRFTDPQGRSVWRPVNEAFAYPTFN